MAIRLIPSFGIFYADTDVPGLKTRFPPCAGKSLDRVPNLPKYSLRNVNGICIDVQLERKDGFIFLGEGWETFVSENNVEDEQLLLFMNDEPMVFDVAIYDCDGLQIFPEKYAAPTSDDYHTFKITLNKTNFQRDLIVLPKAFWNNFILPAGLQNVSEMSINYEMKTWTLAVKNLKDRHILHKGCKEIFNHFNLRKRSVLQFKVQDETTVRLDMTILKK